MGAEMEEAQEHRVQQGLQDHRGLKDHQDQQVQQDLQASLGHKVHQETKALQEIRDRKATKDLRVIRDPQATKVLLATKDHQDHQVPLATTATDSTTYSVPTYSLSTTRTEFYFKLLKPLLWRAQGCLAEVFLLPVWPVLWESASLFL